MDVKLSQIKPLADASLLAPQLAGTALHWLASHTMGDFDKTNRLVFSRSSTTSRPFGKDIFGKHMREELGDGMDCDKLRERIEVEAKRLLEQKKISAADHALVSQLLQHKAQTASIDYCSTGEREDEHEHEYEHEYEHEHEEQSPPSSL
eukprot:COSAG02_NODE_207_length_29119_cov_41.071365_23_plen_149_part_00